MWMLNYIKRSLNRARAVGRCWRPMVALNDGSSSRCYDVGGWPMADLLAFVAHANFAREEKSRAGKQRLYRFRNHRDRREGGPFFLPRWARFGMGGRVAAAGRPDVPPQV